MEKRRQTTTTTTHRHRLCEREMDHNRFVRWSVLSLFFVVGLSSWLLTNGIFLQIPILIKRQPESSSISSFIILFTQIGNILGLGHFLIRGSSRVKQYSLIFSKMSLLLILVMAGVVAVLLANMWNRVTITNGRANSVPLWILSLFAGAVGSLSTVVMIPFASRFGTIYTSSIATGMACSGLLSSIISIVQAPELDHPLLGVSEYFYVLLCFIFLSFVCACILSFSNIIHDESTTSTKKPTDKAILLLSPPEEDLQSFCGLVRELKSPLLNQCYISVMAYSILGLLPYLGINLNSNGDIVFWLTMSGIICGALGRALTIKLYFYHLKITTIPQVVLWIYLMTMIFIQQRNLIHVGWGWLSVVCFGGHAFLYGFSDTINYQKVAFHLPGNPHLIERGSSFVGVSNQVGAITGSLISFILAIYFLRFG